MTIKEVFESWITDIISSALGLALINFAFDVKSTNQFWWIAFVFGIILQIPLVYFKIIKFIEKVIK